MDNSKERLFIRLVDEVHRTYPTSSIDDLLGTYIKDRREPLRSDEEGLLSLFFIKLLGDKMDQQQKGELMEIVNKTMQSAIDHGDKVGGIVGKTLATASITRQQVATYFRTSLQPYDYFQVYSLDQPLADTIMRLECMETVEKYKDEFVHLEHTGWVIDYFEDTKTGGKGIWMSVHNILFDPNLVKND